MAANINPKTGLATDYLNHFNEAIMLLEMIPSMPECTGDFLAWEPLSYAEHFIASQLFSDIGQSPLDIASDRFLMCGSPAMLEELRRTFEARGFAEGSHGEPGHFVIEKAFVER